MFCDGMRRHATITYHLGRLGSCNVELEIGVLLPVAKEQGKFEKESVVGIAQSPQGLGAGVAVQAALQTLAGAYKLLPVLEVIGIGVLQAQQMLANGPLVETAGATLAMSQSRTTSA